MEANLPTHREESNAMTALGGLARHNAVLTTLSNRTAVSNAGLKRKHYSVLAVRPILGSE